MGVYINPPTETKEYFLKREGKEIDINFQYENTPEESLPVILVDNGPFTAVAVAYDKREFEAFTDLGDNRPKKLYLVEINKLLPVVSEDLLSRLNKK